MTTTGQDFEFWTGEDKALIYTITDETGASVNLTGYSASWVLQDEPNSGSLLKLKTGGSGITISGCTATVTLMAAHTSGCALSGYFYTELSACDTADYVAVLAVGYAKINRKGY